MHPSGVLALAWEEECRSLVPQAGLGVMGSPGFWVVLVTSNFLIATRQHQT